MATNPGLKKVNAEDEYTPHMIEELRRCKKDPVYFINNYVKTQHPTRGTVPFILFDYQERFVRCLQTERFVISLQPRQMGKTLTGAIFLLWYATFHSDSTLLIASKNMSHALEIAGRVRFAYEELPNWIKCGVKYYNRKTIEFDNGSRIICEATTEKTGRGLSISKILLDELGFIAPRIQQELWASLTPTLSTGGSAIISSTPNGDTELFAQLWRDAMSNGGDKPGLNGYYPFRVWWNEHPERDETYYETMKGQLGALVCRQEVDCISGDSIVNTSMGLLAIEDLYDRINDTEIQAIKLNKNGVTIDTPSGLKSFSGITKTWHDELLQLECADGTTIKCSKKHVFVREDGWAKAHELVAGNKISKADWALTEVNKISILPGEYLYEPLDVDGGHLYIANGLINHNCEFLSSDALLINSMVLYKLRPTQHLYEDMGFKFWIPQEQLGGNGKIYLVGIDPATGSGSDYSVIEVFEFPSMKQVAEWRSNEINVPLLYAKTKWLLNMLTCNIPGRGRAEAIWSFERNGIGEALVTQYMNDDKAPEYAELYSDAANKYGVFTTGQNKINTCIQLKTLVERGNGIKFSSSIIIEELKNFVAKGNGYDHKAGSTGDAVSAVLVVMRLLKRLSEYDEEAFKKMNEYVAPDAPEAMYTEEAEHGDTSVGDNEPFPFAF